MVAPSLETVISPSGPIIILSAPVKMSENEFTFRNKESFAGLTARTDGGLDDGGDRTSGEDVRFDSFEAVRSYLSALIFYDNILISSFILSVLSSLHRCAELYRFVRRKRKRKGTSGEEGVTKKVQVGNSRLSNATNQFQCDNSGVRIKQRGRSPVTI